MRPNRYEVSPGDHAQEQSGGGVAMSPVRDQAPVESECRISYESTRKTLNCSANIW